MAQAKAIIQTEANLDGIEKAKQGLLNLGAGVERVESIFKAALPSIGMIAATKKIVEFGAEATKEFGTAERSLLQLKAACELNGNSFTRLSELIEQSNKHTTASKDEVEKLVAELTSLGKSNTEIEKITNASIALSNVTGKDLNSAFTMLNASYAGNAKALNKLIPDIGSLSKEQLAAGQAIDIVNAKLGAISDTMSNGFAQKTKNLKSSFEELKESIGANLAPVFTPMLDNITALINRWTDAANATAQYKKALVTLSTTDLKLSIDKLDAEYKRKKVEYNNAFAEMTASGEANNTVPKLKKELDELQNKIVNATNTLQNIITQNPIEKYIAPMSDAAGTIFGESAGQKIKEIVNLNFTEEGKRYRQAWIGKPADNDAAVDPNSRYHQSVVTSADESNSRYHQTPNGSAGEQEYQGAYIKESSIEHLSKVISSAFQYSEIGQVRADKAKGDKGDGLLGTVAKLFNSSIVSMISSIENVQKILNPITTILTGVFKILTPIINSILQPIVGILMIIGTSIGKVIAPLLKQLEPIIELVSFAFVALYNYAIKPLFNSIIWVISTVYNLIANTVNSVIKAINKLPAVNIKWRMATLDYDSLKLDDITASDVTAAGADTSTNNSSGSSSSASYNAVSAINIYVNVEGSIVPYNNFVSELRSSISEAISYNR